MKKVVVRIGGGLGNQMFQYANAWRIATDTGRSLFLDKSEFFISLFFKIPYRRIYLLDRFPNVKSTPHLSGMSAFCFFSLWVARKLMPLHAVQKIFQILHVQWFDAGPESLDENQISLALVKTSENVFCSGVPCHLPLLPPREKLRYLFTFPRCETTKEQEPNSVSVHIRRTDYQTGGICLPTNYYRLAMKEMAKRVRRPRWLFFSDDIGWCKQTFADVKNATYSEGDIVDPICDLAKMSACRHHIIANSTFSWWGAYLGNDDGIVMYPSNWETSAAKIGDHIPASWIRIAVPPPSSPKFQDQSLEIDRT